MAQELKVDHEELKSAHDKLNGVASTAGRDATTASANLHKLVSGPGHAVFSALVGEIVEDVRAHVPTLIKELIESYAVGLLDIDAATTETDEEIAAKFGSSSVAVAIPMPSPPGGVLQGSGPSVQGGSPNLQGSGPNLQGGGGSRGVGVTASGASTGTGAGVGAPAAAPKGVAGPGAFKNSAISDAADEYGTGEWGGQCRSFVSRVVKSATGVDVSAYQNAQHDYFASLAAHGTQITDVAQLRPGDIVQVGQFESDRHLHTFIIDGVPYQKDGAWYVHVVDSNHHPNSELVDHYDREIVLSDDQRAYRLGQP